MPPTILQGSTRSDEILQSSLKISMEEYADRLEFAPSVLDTITRKVGGGVESVGRMKHQGRKRTVRAMSDIVGAAGAAVAAISIPVTNAENFHLDEVVYCPRTEEAFFVNETVGGTAAAGHILVRGFAGNGGLSAALVAGDTLLILGEAHAEGEDIPPAFANKEEDYFVYLWQTDETIKLTDIQNAEEQYGMKELMARRADKSNEQIKKMALAMYLSKGGREIVSASGPRRHTMTGIFEQLENQVTDATAIVGGLTRTTLGTIVRPTTIYGQPASQKVCLIGQNAQASISAMPDQFLQIESGDGKTWGVNVTKLITAFGTLNLTFEPLFSQENGLAGEMLILDTKNVKQLQMRGLPFTMQTNVQAKRDLHNIEDAYTGTRGLLLKLAELHRRVKGI